jgi:hypothetical protein
MSRIEKLTKEQEELMPDVRDEWINFCLSGDTSIDQKECSDGIEWLYLLAKLKKPIFLAFAEGPLAAQGIANIFPNVLKAIGIKKPVWNSVENSVRNSVWNSVENSVRNSVRNSVWNSVENSVGNSVGNSVENSVRNSVWNSVENSVWNSVWNSVENSVGNSVENSVGNSVGNSVRNSVRNSVWNSVENSVRNSVRNSVEKYEPPYCGLGWWSGWFAFCDYFEKLGISTEDFKRFRKWVKSGAWDVLWFENLCVVTCRPSMIRKDAQGRLHCDDGPAAKWPSGEEYWFLHGVNVSEKIVMKTDELTVEEISNEKNSEISRAIAEKLGWDRYMGTLGTVLIDKWFDPSKSLHYELYDFKSRKFSLMPRLLKMESPEILDGTRPYYIEPVDPKLNSCQSARKWQFKLLDGEWPTVEECNKNPELVFEVEA